MTAIRDFARVGENAIPAGTIQGHVARTPASVSAVLVVASVRALVRSFRALVHVRARAPVLQDPVSLRADASVSPGIILAHVRAIVSIFRALVYIDTGPAVGVEDESRVTGALVSAV